MNLARFSIRHPVTVIMGIFVMLTIGLMSLWELPTDMFPEITFPVLSIVTRYAAAAPEEVENLVTKPLEEALATINGVKNITSTSQHGRSMINLEFDWEYDLDAAANDVRDSIQYAKRFLPEDCELPVVVKIDLSKIPIWVGTMRGKRSFPSLQRLAERTIQPRLSRIEGVAAVGILSSEEEEVEITADLQALERHRLGFNRLYKLLMSENRNIPAGDVRVGGRVFSLRTMGETDNVSRLGDIPIVAGPDGSVLTLSRLASIRRIPRRDDVIIERNGYPVIALQVMKQSGKNTVQVLDKVNAEIERIRKTLPGDIVLENVFDQSEFINKSISAVRVNLVTGGLLAVSILFFFLRRLGLVLIIGLAIPLSVLMSFIPLYFLRYSLNTMSLGGLALGVGMLVDNAIVVLENIERHLRLGAPPAEAAERGTHEVLGAITGSTLTTLAVFIPFLFSVGIAAKMFSQLGVAITASLLASLLLAGTLAPMMAARLATAGSTEVESYVHRWYRRVLAAALAYPRLVFVAFIVLFAAVMVLIPPRLGIEFLPVPDDGMIGSPFRLPTGMSLEESNQVIRPLAALLGSDSRVLSCFHRVGFPAGAEEAGAVIGLSDHNEGEFFLRLKPKAERNVSTKDFIEEIRSVTKRIPGLEINLRQSGEQLFNSDKAAITIQVFGPDLPTLKAQLTRIREAIRTVDGVRDLDVDLLGGKPELQVHIDRQKAVLAGLNLPDIAFALRTAVQGRRISLFRQEGDEMYIRLRGPRELERSPEAILDIPLDTSPVTATAGPIRAESEARTVATLRSFARIEPGSGEEKLFRERQMRRGMVYANYAGRSLGEVVGDIQKRLSSLEMPEGYFFTIGGMYEDTVEAGKQLLYVFVLGVILVYMIMASQFESFKDPFVVFFSVPLAAIGMFIGLYGFRQTINISSALGLVILLGIAVNNAIVLIDFIRQLRLQGVSLTEALVDGPTARLRPVAMTTLTTVLGLLPLALGYGDGAELQQPLAISLICGLSFSTLLTLIVVPCLYKLLNHDTLSQIAQEE